MSDDHANQSPVDMRLPDELARCESILAGMSLPRSGVERDELMYRAGWAAAEVAAKSPLLHGAERQQSARSTSGRSACAWSASSAVIAASLAVAITLRLQPAAVVPVGLVVDPGSEDGPAIAVVDAGQPPSESRAIPSPSPFVTGAQVAWTAPLLIMRDRALRQQWDDPRIVVTEASFVESSPGDAIPSQPKTSREMLQEFLPRPSSQATLDSDSTPFRLRWPWRTNRLGETT